MEIIYKTDKALTVNEFVDLLKRSTLAERRPIDDPDRLKKMLNNANILVTAWDKDLLVGIARAITDYAYCTYLSDVAVDVSYQRRGIGKEVMRVCRKLGGEDVPFFLFAAPAAADYYKHIGFTSITTGWILTKGEKIK